MPTHDTVAKMINRRGVQALHDLKERYSTLEFVKDSIVQWYLCCEGTPEVNTQFIKGIVYIKVDKDNLLWYTEITGVSYEEIVRCIRALRVAVDQTNAFKMNAEPIIK